MRSLLNWTGLYVAEEYANIDPLMYIQINKERPGQFYVHLQSIGHEH